MAVVRVQMLLLNQSSPRRRQLRYPRRWPYCEPHHHHRLQGGSLQEGSLLQSGHGGGRIGHMERIMGM